MTSLTYAIGDVHGRNDLLSVALDAVESHAGTRQAKVIFLGDYVDRGPESRQVVETLVAGPRREGDEWTCLRGNHEELMLGAAKGCRASEDCWAGNGGVQTMASYGQEIPAEHIAWLDGLPYVAADKHRVYVHAGLMPGYPVEEQEAEWVTWIRDRFLRAGDVFGVHVVHGHTPAWDGKLDPAKAELLPHRTNLDTAAFYTGVLTVGVFDPDKAGGPVELIEVRGMARDGSGNEKPTVLALASPPSE